MNATHFKTVSCPAGLTPEKFKALCFSTFMTPEEYHVMTGRHLYSNKNQLTKDEVRVIIKRRKLVTQAINTFDQADRSDKMFPSMFRRLRKTIKKPALMNGFSPFKRQRERFKLLKTELANKALFE